MLRVAPASPDEVRYALTAWHYLGSVPAVVVACYAVYEDGRFVGVVVFTRGSRFIGAPFGLPNRDVVELARVAMTTHRVPVTAVLARAVDLLRAAHPNVRLIVSYADPEQGHRGGIYQAGNWTYLGTMPARDFLVIDGRVWHPRSANQAFGTSSVRRLRAMGLPVETTPKPGKHKYVLPLDGQMRRRLRRAARPYPRAVEVSMATRLSA